MSGWIRILLSVMVAGMLVGCSSDKGSEAKKGETLASSGEPETKTVTGSEADETVGEAATNGDDASFPGSRESEAAEPPATEAAMPPETEVQEPGEPAETAAREPEEPAGSEPEESPPSEPDTPAETSTLKVEVPPGPVRVAPPREGLTAIGVDRCAKCHKVQHASWLETEHAKLDPPLDCEACHGPGSEYRTLKIMKDPVAARAAGLVDPSPEFCARCHVGGWEDSMLERAHAHKEAEED